MGLTAEPRSGEGASWNECNAVAEMYVLLTDCSLERRSSRIWKSSNILLQVSWSL